MKRFLACVLLLLVASTAHADTANVNGTTLYYETRGEGEPLILLQGGNLDLRMWDEQFDVLSRTYRVVRYDVRGFGRSGPYGKPYRALDDLAGLLDVLKIERAHLVGLSLGGRIAIDFAVVHPARVMSLVLAGPGLSGFAWSRMGNEWYEPIAKAVERHDSLVAATLWLKSPYMAPAMEDSAVAARLRVLAGINSRVWAHRDSETPLSPPAATRLGSIRAPVLILIGARDVPDIHRIVELLMKDIPTARRIIVGGAGHMLNLERPDAFNKAVIQFIETL